jgi:hypothetical protein
MDADQVCVDLEAARLERQVKLLAANLWLTPEQHEAIGTLAKAMVELRRIRKVIDEAAAVLGVGGPKP